MAQQPLPKWTYLIVSCVQHNGDWRVSSVNSQKQNIQSSMVDFTLEAGKHEWELVSTHLDPPVGRNGGIIRLFFKKRFV